MLCAGTRTVPLGLPVSAAGGLVWEKGIAAMLKAVGMVWTSITCLLSASLGPIQTARLNVLTYIII